MFTSKIKLGFVGAQYIAPLLLACLLSFTTVHAQSAPLFSFEDGIQNWQMTAGTSGISLDVSTNFASDGAQSLAVSVNYDDTQWQETSVYVQPSAPLDW